MKILEINKNEAGQRFDKYLRKLLNKAPDSFIYKMLRKKNIVLNGKKSDGGDILNVNDEVKLFLSDETFEKFSGVAKASNDDSAGYDSKSYDLAYSKAYKKFKNIKIIYEDDNILVADKPAGVLSQKATKDDLSVNEWLIGYLLEQNIIDIGSLSTFKPSVCNRLDRNTSGMVICGKSLIGSQYLSAIIKDKSLEKYYYCLVDGEVNIDERISGYLYKDETKNKVRIYDSIGDVPGNIKAEYIDTKFKTVKVFDELTLLEVQLFTGKTHQIRAHLASINHPIIGDLKYGNADVNRRFAKYGVRYQLLHAHKLVFPPAEDVEFRGTSNKVLECELPSIFNDLVRRAY